MIKLLTSPWTTALVGIVLYLGTTVAVWKTPTPPPSGPKATAAAGEKKAGPSWDFTSPEADQLIAELKTEKKALGKKEQDLNDLMARLQAERSELNLVTQSNGFRSERAADHRGGNGQSEEAGQDLRGHGTGECRQGFGGDG
jgi:hypothetical protein